MSKELIKVVRWPELDILTTNLQVIDEFWTRTDKGPIFTAFLFPFNQLEKLRELKARIELKEKELSDINAEIYKVSRDFGK